MFRSILMFVVCSLALFTTSAQDTDVPPAENEAGTVAADDSAHQDLRQLRTDLEAAVASGEWQTLEPFLSSKVVVTWMDGTQSHGAAAVIEYLESKTKGPEAIVDDFSLSTEVTELSDLHGDDTAIAFGSATSAFVLRGRELSMSGPWSATMVREADDWKLASLTASVGAFDNPLLTWTWRLVWIVGGIAAVLGLFIGWLVGRRTHRVAS